MPWKKSEKGQDIYIPENKNNDIQYINSDTFLASIQCQVFNQKLTDVSNLSKFIESKLVAPIHVNGKDLKNEEETRGYIKEYHKKPFTEAERSGSMLSTFCFAHGMEYEDLFILRDDPNNPRYEEINNRFENLRHGFFEMVCCDDEKKRDELVTDYYVKLMDRTENAMEKLNQKDSLNFDDFIQYAILTDNFHSIGVQTLELGSSDQYGQHYVDLINNELQKKGKAYDFDLFFNSDVIASMSSQASRKMAKTLQDSKLDGEEIDNEGVLNNLISPSKTVLWGYEQFKDFFKKDGKNANQKIADFTLEKLGKVRMTAFDMIYSKEFEQHMVSFLSEGTTLESLRELSEKYANTILQTEKQGTLGNSNNSKEFQAVQDCFIQETIDGSSTSAEKLYNACKEYIKAKDGNPMTSSGKDRLRAVSSLMAVTASRVLANNPEKANEINEDFKAFSKKSKIFQSELKTFNKSNLEKLNTLSKNEIQSIKDTMKLGVTAENKGKVIDSMSKLVVSEFIKKSDSTNHLDIYTDPDFIQKKADSLKPFVNNLIKNGDPAAINKALNGKNPGKDFADLFEKNYNNNIKNRSVIEAEYETEKMQLDAMKL